MVCWTIAVVVGTVAAVSTAELKPRTLAAFDRYISVTEAHLEAMLERDESFLWVEVKETLRRMIDDETGHIGWVWRALQAYSREHGNGVVEDTMHRLQKIDRRVYERLSTESPFQEYFSREDDRARNDH